MEPGVIGLAGNLVLLDAGGDTPSMIQFMFNTGFWLMGMGIGIIGIIEGFKMAMSIGGGKPSSAGQKVQRKRQRKKRDKKLDRGTSNKNGGGDGSGGNIDDEGGDPGELSDNDEQGGDDNDETIHTDEDLDESTVEDLEDELENNNDDSDKNNGNDDGSQEVSEEFSDGEGEVPGEGEDEDIEDFEELEDAVTADNRSGGSSGNSSNGSSTSSSRGSGSGSGGSGSGGSGSGSSSLSSKLNAKKHLSNAASYASSKTPNELKRTAGAIANNPVTRNAYGAGSRVFSNAKGAYGRLKGFDQKHSDPSLYDAMAHTAKNSPRYAKELNQKAGDAVDVVSDTKNRFSDYTGFGSTRKDKAKEELGISDDTEFMAATEIGKKEQETDTDISNETLENLQNDMGVTEEDIMGTLESMDDSPENGRELHNEINERGGDGVNELKNMLDGDSINGDTENYAEATYNELENKYGDSSDTT